MKHLILSFSFLSLFFLFGCGLTQEPKIEVAFHLNKIENTVPSYQMAIWTENSEGKYIETLFVCDYLSYGGFNIKGVCPVWVKKSHWEKATEEMLDAVTQATPDIGDVKLEFNAPTDRYPAGDYKFFIEIHNTENYNEIYSGKLTVKPDGSSLAGKVTVTYKPKKYPEGSGLLSNVKARYYVAQEK